MRRGGFTPFQRESDCNSTTGVHRFNYYNTRTNPKVIPFFSLFLFLNCTIITFILLCAWCFQWKISEHRCVELTPKGQAQTQKLELNRIKTNYQNDLYEKKKKSLILSQNSNAIWYPGEDWNVRNTFSRRIWNLKKYKIICAPTHFKISSFLSLDQKQLYIYIVNQRQVVSLHHNSPVWRDTLDLSS